MDREDTALYHKLVQSGLAPRAARVLLEEIRPAKRTAVYRNHSADISGQGGMLRFDESISDGPFVTPSQADWDDEGDGPAAGDPNPYPVPALTKGVYSMRAQYFGASGNGMLARLIVLTYPYRDDNQEAWLMQTSLDGQSAFSVPSTMVVDDDSWLIVAHSSPDAVPDRYLDVALWVTRVG